MLDLCGLIANRSINEFGNFLGNSTNWFQFGTNCACDTFKQSVFIEKIDELAEAATKKGACETADTLI